MLPTDCSAASPLSQSCFHSDSLIYFVNRCHPFFISLILPTDCCAASLLSQSYSHSDSLIYFVNRCHPHVSAGSKLRYDFLQAGINLSLEPWKYQILFFSVACIRYSVLSASSGVIFAISSFLISSIIESSFTVSKSVS